VYPSAVRRDSSFDRSALFLTSFSPTLPLVKLIVAVVPVGDVDVLVVPVDEVAVVAVLPAFLEFAAFVDDMSALADLVPAFVVAVCFAAGTFTGFTDALFTGFTAFADTTFADTTLADGLCVFVDGRKVVEGP
jgi:hypothetical protein